VLLETSAAQQVETFASCQRSECDGQERHPRTAQTRLPLGTRIVKKRAGQRHQRSRASSGQIVTHGTPLRLVDGLGAPTIIMITAHATTTIEGTHSAMTATTTVTAAGRQTSEVRELSARASWMRGFPHISVL
jgi:hypothetical protein